MHRVVVSCAAEGGQASEEGEGAGVRFNCETEVLACNLGDDGEAAVWIISFDWNDGSGGSTSRSHRDQFALLSGRRLRGQRRESV